MRPDHKQNPHTLDCEVDFNFVHEGTTTVVAELSRGRLIHGRSPFQQHKMNGALVRQQMIRYYKYDDVCSYRC